MGGGHTPNLLTCGILTRVTLVTPYLNSLLWPWNNKIVSTLVFYQHSLYPCGIECAYSKPLYYIIHEKKLVNILHILTETNVAGRVKHVLVMDSCINVTVGG